MRKNEIDAILRAFTKDQLSPQAGDREFVSKVYASVGNALGKANCLQIGSFARYTAIRPLHDLDVLYVAGSYENEDPDPSECLAELLKQLRDRFRNPTDLEFELHLQTHSVTICFKRGLAEVFSVDVVPAYTDRKNEFGLDMYVVPEIAMMGRVRKAEVRKQVVSGQHRMRWIRSDPRGYVQLASQLNAKNEDFRRSAKFLKGWRAACKRRDSSFALKSFHLEQAVGAVFERNPNSSIFDAVFEVMCQMPDLVRYPRFPDRADHAVHIDEYVSRLSHSDRRKIDKCRDHFLVQLEELKSANDISSALSGDAYERVSDKETFLFDQRIPMLSETEFKVIGAVLEKKGGFRAFVLNAIGHIRVTREIKFQVGRDAPTGCMFKWKVRNDKDSKEPRGEITDHRTLSDPEKTAYIGTHWVECFAVRDGICVGRGKQYVRLDNLTPEM
ncbi:MAG: hypothetical protein RLO80_05340 [Hyphomonas sp.]